MSKFTIRIKPEEGECLTSYLYRLASKNECKVSNLIEKIKMPGKRRISKNTIPTLVFSPKDNYDISQLSSLTDLTEKQLLELSIHPFHLKFNHAINLLNREWETRYRRLCPCCLKENGFFKLIWQVKEIEICLIHKLRLRHFCYKCNYLLPYAESAVILDKQCPRCKTLLENGGEAGDKSLTYLKDQTRKYEDWTYLLSSEFNRETFYLSKEALTITYLYFLSLQKSVSKVPIPFFSDFNNTLINSIKTKKKHMNRSVTPLNLLRTLRYYDVKVKDFFQLKAPEKFLYTLCKCQPKS